MMNRHALAALFLVLFAAWVCYYSKTLVIWNPQGPGDGFFPFIGGAALGVLGIFQLLRSVAHEHQDEDRGEFLRTKLFTYIGSLLAYALLFEHLGFLVATFLFMMAILKGAEKAGWKAALIISCLCTGLCFLLFRYLLDVPFPVGFLKAFSS
jgi:putative tricarboxylic transport membrane protein